MRLGLSIFVLLVSVVLLLMSINWPLSAGLFPWVTLSIGVLCSIIQVRNDLVSLKKEAAEHDGEQGADKTNATGELSSDVMAKIFRPLLWLFIFLPLAWLLGFLLAIFVFLFFYLQIEGREKPLFSISCSVAIVFIMWVVFDKIIHVAWVPSAIRQWLGF